MTRRNRKPDAYHLNIVREDGGSSKKSRDVRIERVSIPFSSQVGDNAAVQGMPIITRSLQNMFLVAISDVASKGMQSTNHSMWRVLLQTVEAGSKLHTKRGSYKQQKQVNSRLQ